MRTSWLRPRSWQRVTRDNAAVLVPLALVAAVKWPWGGDDGALLGLALLIAVSAVANGVRQRTLEADHWTALRAAFDASDDELDAAERVVRSGAPVAGARERDLALQVGRTRQRVTGGGRATAVVLGLSGVLLLLAALRAPAVGAVVCVLLAGVATWVAAAALRERSRLERRCRELSSLDLTPRAG